jgi:phosphoribosylformimino-5-aminoimidazole carboxamide ribotide isomerase
MHLRIIPVMDILNGIVVHAVKGRREEYQPLKSVLCDSADPFDVASAFRACGFSELYVADLDAIMGRGTNFAVLRRIVENTGLELVVDAGIADLKRAQEVLQRKVSKIIVGTETLLDLTFVSRAIECFGAEKVVVSLDLMNGKVLSRSKSAKSMSALALAREFQGMGVTQMIVLDLARVGSGKGVDFAFLKEMLNSLEIKVLVGGGVRDIEDLIALKNLGVYGVLLATSLHSGRISVEELRRADMI